METPPPYSAPAKKSNTKLIIILVIALVSVCCILPIAVVGGGMAWVVNKGQGLVTCMIGFEMVPKAIVNYVDAHEGKLPTAAKWNEEVRPYYEKLIANKKSAGPFKFMPADGEWGCTEDSVKTGMVFNSDLSGKKLADIKDRSTVLMFESTRTGKNLNGPYKPLPFNQSPKTMGLNERRGWLVVTVDQEAFLVDENGKRVKSQSTTSF